MLAVILLDAADGVTDLFDAEPILAAKGALELFEDGGGLGDLMVFADEADFLVAADDLDAEGVADHAQITVGRSEQGELLFGLFECDVQLHVDLRAGVGARLRKQIK